MYFQEQRVKEVLPLCCENKSSSPMTNDRRPGYAIHGNAGATSLTHVCGSCHVRLDLQVAVMRMCDHPNVLSCYASFVHENELWLVMEFMSKGSCLHVMNVAKKEVTKCCDIICLVLSTWSTSVSDNVVVSLTRSPTLS